MSRDSQQLARAALPLLKMARQKLGTAGVIGLALAAVLYVAVVQPLVARKLGVTLPTIADVADASDAGRPPQKERPPQEPTPSKSSTNNPSVEPGDLSSVLTETGRDVYRSTAGLRYTRGSQHGTRLAHLMAHTRDDPDRAGSHGVFDSDDPATVVRLVDQAYQQALSGRDTKTEREGDQSVYTVNLGRRVGYVGGQSGNRRGKPAANYLRLVVQGDRLITAFPLRP